MAASDVPSYELIDEVDTGGLKVAVVRAALELDVFTLIDDGATDVETLAAACGCATRGMEALVRALLSLELLEHTDGGGLQCSPTASAYLVSGGDGYAAPIYLAWFRNRDRLVEAIRSGRPPVDHARDDADEEWRAYAAPDLVRWPERTVSLATMLGERGLRAAPGERIVDLGCGSGIWSFALATAQPDVEVLCIDRDGVLDVARDLAARMGLADRVEFAAGHVEEAALAPRSFDITLLTNVAQYLDDERLDRVLAHVGASLRPAGRLYLTTVVVDDGTPDNSMNWSSGVEMYLASSVDQRSAAEVIERLRRAGFSDVTQCAANAFLTGT